MPNQQNDRQNQEQKPNQQPQRQNQERTQPGRTSVESDRDSARTQR